MNWKAIIALLVALGAGLGVWAIVKDGGGGTTVVPPGAKPVFERLTPGDVQRLDLVWRETGGAETAMAFERDGAGWTVTAGDLRDAGDPAHVRKVVEAMVKLRQQRAVPAEDGAGYGLHPAAVELRATLQDGRAVGVRIGAVAWKDNLRYLQVAGEQEVRIVSDELYGHCRHPVSWFRDHHVVTIPNFEVTKFTVTNPAGTIAVERSGPGWRQTAPVADEADTTTVQEFLGRIYTDTQARRFIDRVPEGERAKYGLDTPFLDVTLTADRGRTCRVRYSEGPGEYEGKTVQVLYALRDGRLFDCGPDQLEALRIRNLNFFRTQAITKVDGKALNLLQVTPPGRPRWSLVREGHKWSIAEPRRLSPNSDIVRLLPDIVDGLRSERYFDQAGESDWAAFGVDDANGTVVKLADQTGVHDSFTVGKVVPGTKDAFRYVRLHDGDRIRAMNARWAAVLTGSDRGWLYYLDKQLWRVISPEVSQITIESREPGGMQRATWDVTLEANAPKFTLQAGSTAHAAGIANGDLTDTLSSLATLRTKHWVQDGHGNLQRFGLADDGWRLRVTLQLQRDGGGATRTLLFGDDILWPAAQGEPQKEVYVRTGTGTTLAGPLIFTVRDRVLAGLRALVVEPPA
ncbi:MAG: DUF4340 domain-containing protein, partial [Planctomycetota bacterium]